MCVKFCNQLAQIQQQGRESNEGAASFLRLLGNRVDVVCERKGVGFPGRWVWPRQVAATNTTLVFNSM